MTKACMGLLAIAALGLAACGQTDLERGASGAAIGAGAAAVTDNDVGVGAAVGGLAGIFCDDAGAC